jgi:hypothetical protein
MLKLPEFLDNRHTGRFYPPGETPGTHFFQRLCRLQGHSVAGRVRPMKNSKGPLGNRNHPNVPMINLYKSHLYELMPFSDTGAWTPLCQSCTNKFKHSSNPLECFRNVAAAGWQAVYSDLSLTARPQQTCYMCTQSCTRLWTLQRSSLMGTSCRVNIDVAVSET